jgi:hypothetical protein
MALRSPRPPGPDLRSYWRIGGADVLARRGHGGILLVSTGVCARPAVAAAADITASEDITVVDPR